jgi:hypothetical protein
LTALNAWAVLLEASGESMPAVLDVPTRWRLRTSLQQRGLEALCGRLRDRADVRRLCAPSTMAVHALRADERLVFTGMSVTSAAGAPAVQVNALDAYVPAALLTGLLGDYALCDSPASGASVTLRAVPDLAWHLDGRRVAPIAAVALDLWGDQDPEVAGAGERLLERLGEQALEKSTLSAQRERTRVG